MCIQMCYAMRRKETHRELEKIDLKRRIHLPLGTTLTKTQPTPLNRNENAWVFRLEKRSMKYHDVKNAGTSTMFTSIKFKYLLPENSTEDNERP